MAHSTSETAFLTLEFSFPFRGDREHYSCTFHVDSVPISATQWTQLKDMTWANVQGCLSARSQFEYAYGHEPGTPPVLVWEYDVPPVAEGGAAGTLVPAPGSQVAPGDAAAWVRWGTTQRNSLGKPIYLRNYFHDVHTTADGDTLDPNQHAALEALGTAWVQGMAAGGTTFRRAGPRGAVAQNHAVSAFATTRTLKHRGRRHRWTNADVRAIADGKYPGYLLPKLSLNG